MHNQIGLDMVRNRLDSICSREELRCKAGEAISRNSLRKKDDKDGKKDEGEATTPEVSTMRLSCYLRKLTSSLTILTTTDINTLEEDNAV